MIAKTTFSSGYVPPRAEDLILRFELSILSKASTGDDVPVDPDDPWLDDEE